LQQISPRHNFTVHLKNPEPNGIRIHFLTL
jgi:hypothetical protein